MIDWNKEIQAYPGDLPDYHRAQIERWLWDQRDRFTPPVLDIGAGWRRTYIPASITLNTGEYDIPYADGAQHHVPDVTASVCQLPYEDNQIGTIICTETLEHVANLFRAVLEIKRVLRPNGWAFITTPFLWPTHDTQDYPDFWRLTEQAYRYLFSDAQTLHISPTIMQKPVDSLWGMVAAGEKMGDAWEVTAPTGYMVAFRKRDGISHIKIPEEIRVLD